MVTALGPTPLGYGAGAYAPTPTLEVYAPRALEPNAPVLRRWGLRPDAYSRGDHGTSTPLTSGASCSATRFSAFCVSAVTFLLLTSIRNCCFGAARRFGAPFSLAVRRRRWCTKNLYFAPLAKDREVASSTWRRTSCTVAFGFAARIVCKAFFVRMDRSDRSSFFSECFNRRLAFLIHVPRRRAFKTPGEQSAGTRTPQAGTCELADEPGVSSCAWAASGLSARITVAINDALFDPHVDRNPGGGRRSITSLISLLVTGVSKKSHSCSCTDAVRHTWSKASIKSSFLPRGLGDAPAR